MLINGHRLSGAHPYQVAYVFANGFIASELPEPNAYTVRALNQGETISGRDLLGRNVSLVGYPDGSFVPVVDGVTGRRYMHPGYDPIRGLPGAQGLSREGITAMVDYLSYVQAVDEGRYPLSPLDGGIKSLPTVLPVGPAPIEMPIDRIPGGFDPLPPLRAPATAPTPTPAPTPAPYTIQTVAPNQAGGGGGASQSAYTITETSFPVSQSIDDQTVDVTGSRFPSWLPLAAIGLLLLLSNDKRGRQ